jgi:hypothetical protein
MSAETRQYVIRLFAWCVAGISAAITVVLLIRVLLDGNAPLVAQITLGFTNTLPQLIAFLTATILGEPVISAFAARLNNGAANGATSAAPISAPATQVIHGASSDETNEWRQHRASS